MDYVIIAIIGLIVGAMLAFGLAMEINEINMVEACCGQYNSRSGAFEIVNMCEVKNP